MAKRLHGAERILFFAQMSDHSHAKATLDRLLPQQRIGRLINHFGFRAQARRKFLHAFALQHHQSRCDFETAARCRVGPDITIKIGAGEHYDQRTIRMRTVKPVRRVAAFARMKCNH